ncbi:MAG: hypothetical protein JW846_03925 [Dehalococcoidia bacterium]|nr:hypothetical protein [Dehalococcoidia bacterium]
MTDGQVQAIELFARNCAGGCSAAHARKVSGLATSLFDQLLTMGFLPEMTESDRLVLMAASHAHNVGPCGEELHPDKETLPSRVPIEPSDAYGATSCQALRTWLMNPPPPLKVNPLAAEDRSALLYTILWNTAAEPSPIPEEPLLDPGRTMKLAGILRLADGLAEPPRNLVAGCSVLQSSAWIRVLVRSIADVSKEVATAQRRSDLLARALGLRVFVQQVVE